VIGRREDAVIRHIILIQILGDGRTSWLRLVERSLDEFVLFIGCICLDGFRRSTFISAETLLLLHEVRLQACTRLSIELAISCY
jgi:hypothetical protein